MLNRNNRPGHALGLLLLLLASVPAVAAQEWITLTPAGEGFSVRLPSKPREEAGKTPILGNNYLMKLYAVVSEPNHVLYMAVMQEFPAAAVATIKPAERLDQFMSGFREGFLKDLTAPCPNVDLHLERELTLKDRPGREYSISCKNLYGLIRVFDNETRLYVLLAAAHDEREAGPTKFLQSFELLPAPLPVALPKSETKSSQD